MSSKLSKDSILADISHKSLNNIIVLDTVDSTNTYAKSLLTEKAAHETVVVANSQTNGRGRLGRDFFSPPDTGIYMSIVLDPGSISLDPKLLTVAAGVAVCESLFEFGLEPKIKWVNDIFVNVKKVCGILAENTVHSGLSWIILGIGMNVCTAQFPEDLKGVAGAAFSYSVDRNKIIAQTLNRLKELYDHSYEKNLIEKYRSYSLVLGKEVTYRKENRIFTGIATDINEAGNLVVTLLDGAVEVLLSGEVSLGSSNFCLGGDF